MTRMLNYWTDIKIRSRVAWFALRGRPVAYKLIIQRSGPLLEFAQTGPACVHQCILISNDSMDKFTYKIRLTED
jgi:hypothetical protein